MSVASEFDLGPLTWVKGEIDSALERAAEALGQFREHREPTYLRLCRTHVHQVHGALAIVGLDGVTQVTESLESLLTALEEEKAPSVETALLAIERALPAVRQYLDDLTAGEANQPLRLLPIYREISEARGAIQLRASDLFFPDLSVRPPRRTAPVLKLDPEAFRQCLKNERMRFQKGLLAWLKNAPDSEAAKAGLEQMRQALRTIESTQETPSARSFWWISQGFLDALADQGVAVELDAKQLCARIDLQIRRLLEGSRNVAERLMRDALYFVGRAPAEEQGLAADVRKAYHIEQLIPSGESVPSAAPQEAALKRLREVVNAAEEYWNKFCAGNTAALAGFAEQSRHCGQVTAAIGQTDLKRLGQGLASIAAWLAEDSAHHSEATAMEVATAILLLQNAQENFKRLGIDFARQVDLMVARLQACISGQAIAADGDLPLLDDMTRRAQEKLLIAQVAREIQSNLAQVELALDTFFRDPATGLDATALDAPIKQISGALSMLGHDTAQRALLEAGAQVKRFGEPGYQPDPADFEAVAAQLSTLGFFIDALHTGATDYDRFVRKLRGEETVETEDDDTPAEPGPVKSVEAELEQKKGDTQALLAALKETPQDEQLKSELRQNLQALQADADLVADHQLGETAKVALNALQTGGALTPEIGEALLQLKPAVSEAPAPSEETLKLAQASHEEIDAELLEIFLEEAREVLGNVEPALEQLAAHPGDLDTLTDIRRAAHTLKGSGRMVGLRDLGEVAWEVEQTLNLWLRQEQAATPELLEMIGVMQDVFTLWVRELAESTGRAPETEDLIDRARALRGVDPLAAVAAPVAPPLSVSAMEPPETPAQVSAYPADDELPPSLMATVVGDVGMFEPRQEIPPLSEPDVVDFDFSLDLPEPVVASAEPEPFNMPEVAVEPEMVPNEILTALPVAELPDYPLLEIEAPELSTENTASAEAFEFSFDLESEAAASPVVELAEAPFADLVPSSASVNLDLPVATESEPAPSLVVALEALPVDDLPLDVAAEMPVADEIVVEEVSPAIPVTAPEESDNDVAAEPSFLAEEAIDADAAVGIPPVNPAAEMPEDISAIAGKGATLAGVAGMAAAPMPAGESLATEPLAQSDNAGVSNALYEIFLEEARGHLDTLTRSHEELAAMPHSPTTFAMTRAAHTLGGIAATVGLLPINKLAIALEHALLRRDNSVQPDSIQGIETIHQTILALEDMFAGLALSRAPMTQPALIDALEDVFPLSAPDAGVLEEQSAEPAASSPVVIELANVQEADEAPTDVAARLQEMPRFQDELDEQLLPIFLEEATDLVRGFGEQIAAWRQHPERAQESARALARLLHTFKGGARMAGAMNLGEMTHTLETGLEEALRSGSLPVSLREQIENGCDTLTHAVERLQAGESLTLPLLVVATPQIDEVAPTSEIASLPPEAGLAPATPVSAPVVALPLPEGENVAAAAIPAAAPIEAEAGQRAQLRVRADLVDRLVNEAGELSIARARIEGEMLSLKGSLLDLTENVIRLRRQLREIEIQAETQIQARVAQTAEGEAQFDPLELDRFTRFQELTRFMAESVNDVATVQQNLLKNLDDANAALLAQARMNRSLQQDLMSIRMEPFANQGQRLYRIVRQTAKELGKRVDLDIRGGHVEIDRSVQDKIMAPIEHMLRNAISHGIEVRAERQAAGKPETGEIVLQVSQEGNEIVVALSDDGRGLDAERIRARAVELGLLGPDEAAEPARLYDFIFQAGFSTASEVTQISGRGVGMDVVKSEISSLGGRVEIQTALGRGTTFRLYLPLTLAVTQTLLVRAAGTLYAVPSTMIEQVLELKEKGLADIRQQGEALWLENRYPFHFLPHLLGDTQALPETRRRYWVLLLRSGMQRASVLVDELAGNREVVVKNIGAQLSRVVGIAGATVLGDGRVVLILNPVALASRQPATVPVRMPETTPTVAEVATPPAGIDAAADQRMATLPTVLVVDDSLTVRKITGRLLAREGYQVITAKDGVDALEHLVETLPDVMLSDIEMPRMDGFDLVRNVRADDRLKNLPIIMITSRTADKHRNYALEIGANEYLGKPYDEDTLLKLIAGFVKQKRA